MIKLNLYILPQEKNNLEKINNLIGLNVHGLKRKHYSGKILKFTLCSGLNIRLIPFQKIIDGNTLKVKQARNFILGDFILSPLNLDVKKPDLNKLRNSLKEKTKFNRLELNLDLGYLFGFIFGDGYIDRKENRIYVTQSLKHEKYLSKFMNCWYEIVGNKLHENRKNHIRKIEGRIIDSPYITLFRRNKRLIKLYDELTGKSLENIIFLPKNVLRGFIAGIFDSDGCISIRGSNNYKVIEAKFMISNEIETNLNFMLALRRLGIYSKLANSKDSIQRILIQGRNDIKILKNVISGISEKIKSIEIPNRKKVVPARIDRLPSSTVSELCESILKDASTEHINEYCKMKLNCYKNSKFVPYRDSLNKIFKILMPFLGYKTKLDIRNLFKRDSCLEKIVRIKEENYKGTIYYLNGSRNKKIDLEALFVCN